MAKITRSTLQLSEFINKYNEFDDAQISITYLPNHDVFFVELHIKSQLSVYNLVTQKNSLRTFSTLGTIYKTFSFEDGMSITLTFEEI
jgi:hypothetical protein